MASSAVTEALAALTWCGGTVPRSAADAVLKGVGSALRSHHLAAEEGVLVDDDLVLLTGKALRVGSEALLDRSSSWREQCLRQLLPAVEAVVHGDAQDSVRLAAAVCGIRAFELLGVTRDDAVRLGEWALTAAELLRQDGQHEAAQAVLLDATATLQAGS